MMVKQSTSYAGEPSQVVRIPLADLAGYLAAHGLEVVGGTATYGGTFRPVLFLRESKHRAVSDTGDTGNITGRD